METLSAHLHTKGRGFILDGAVAMTTTPASRGGVGWGGVGGDVTLPSKSILITLVALSLASVAWPMKAVLTRHVTAGLSIHWPLIDANCIAMTTPLIGRCHGNDFLICIETWTKNWKNMKNDKNDKNEKKGNNWVAAAAGND